MFKRVTSLLKKLQSVALKRGVATADPSLIDEVLEGDPEYEKFSETYLRLEKSRNCFVIQPYVKWGPQKLRLITPSEQLDEAKALINTLPSWSVEDTISVPLESFDNKSLFKSGTMEKLRSSIRRSSVNAVFVNLGTLKKVQAISLEKEFGVSILDRYRVVMQILKVHATSKHAKLQVALAELYYLQRTTIREVQFNKADKEKVKMMFQSREQKLKTAIKQLRSQRSLLRTRRQKIDYPIVAVVGYTNAGKTSLIKALTGEENLQPRNQLFATLDVTMHSGMLPSGLKVLYVDTVGFISDIPTNLIECFVATLEDAILADVILHVEDLSSSCMEFKREQVLTTLQNLGKKSDAATVLGKIISVGNKCDLVDQAEDFGMLKVSSKNETGLDSLRLQLEDSIMKATDRLKMKIRVPTGGDEIRWLYKNATVVSEEEDVKNSQLVVASIVITRGKLQQFKHHYIEK